MPAEDDVRSNFLAVRAKNVPKSRSGEVKFAISKYGSGTQTPHLGGRNKRYAAISSDIGFLWFFLR
jgi:hypothetical protein